MIFLAAASSLRVRKTAAQIESFTFMQFIWRFTDDVDGSRD